MKCVSGDPSTIFLVTSLTQKMPDPSTIFLVTSFTQKMPEGSDSMHSSVLMLEKIWYHYFT